MGTHIHLYQVITPLLRSLALPVVATGLALFALKLGVMGLNVVLAVRRHRLQVQETAERQAEREERRKERRACAGDVAPSRYISGECGHLIHH